MKKSLEQRIAKLERLMMNESLSDVVHDDTIEQLSDMNKSNQFDRGNFRWATAINALSRLVDVMLSNEIRHIDEKEVDRVYKALERSSYESGTDLVTEIIYAIDRKMEELKLAKKNLNDILRSAKQFDKSFKSTTK